jgi:hypothetical protein
MLKMIPIVVILNLVVSPTTVAQNTHAAPAPIRVTSAETIDARGIDLLHFDFQTLYYGFEGPNYAPMKGEPPAGAQLIAVAELFRAAVVSTVRFELIDASGRTLSPLFFTKRSNDTLNDEFVGIVNIPDGPFSVKVSGVDINGKAFQRTYARVFRPIKGRPAAHRLPAGLSPEQAAKLNRMIEAHDQQTRTKLIEDGRKNPDGRITLPRAEVSETTYEALMSDHGNVIGLRLRYAMRVSQDGYYSFSPSVWPIYADERSRGRIEMQPIALNVDPLPEGLNLKTSALQLRYGGGGTYRAGKTYRFVVDTIPNFAIQNAQRTRFCIMHPSFQSSLATESSWRSLVTSDKPVSYGTKIGWTAFRGRTESFSGPGVFYRSFLKEGAQECSAGGNINF